MKNTDQYIHLEKYEDTAIILLNRPEKGNAFNIQMIRELIDTLKRLEEQSDIRFAIFQSKSRHFCLGADLNWMNEALKLSKNNNVEETTELATLFETIYRSVLIFIARVEGACYGGGIGLASACDYVLGIPEAIFAFGEVKLGLLPATLAPVVFRRLGTLKALQLMLTGEEVPAREALNCGLIDKLYSSDKIEAGVKDLLNSLRSGGRKAQQQLKRLTQIIQPDLYTPETKRITAEMLAYARISDEGAEGVQAFIDKRIPKWRTHV